MQQKQIHKTDRQRSMVRVERTIQNRSRHTHTRNTNTQKNSKQSDNTRIRKGKAALYHRKKQRRR